MNLQVQESLPPQYDAAPLGDHISEFLTISSIIFMCSDTIEKELFGFQKGRKIAGTAELLSAFREVC